MCCVGLWENREAPLELGGMKHHTPPSHLPKCVFSDCARGLRLGPFPCLLHTHTLGDTYRPLAGAVTEPGEAWREQQQFTRAFVSRLLLFYYCTHTHEKERGKNRSTAFRCVIGHEIDSSQKSIIVHNLCEKKEKKKKQSVFESSPVPASHQNDLNESNINISKRRLVQKWFCLLSARKVFFSFWFG